ncbi:phenazine biosynthesis PhzC/PhzF protein [Lophium mytilinum]|uniref:Phenazine biosynthesis PhzC/PhzF protein n=1 Tax=Lophium mytilinum TaxID=390894 RepID=A0A6A6RAH4_9PEZI|nr:phenazine biosynthesis PhzC/PhzF protein [Lophium mytilinum]
MPLPSSHTRDLEYSILDVFTSTRFAGNPLAIVFLPPTADYNPSQSELQAIASEFNLSETIFLHQPTDSDITQAIQRARIFTSTREILFAGHPTIGAAAYLLLQNPWQHALKALVPGAGPIPISLVDGKAGFVKAVVPHTYHEHSQRCPAEKLLALHSTLAPFVGAEQTFPVVSIVKGMTWVLVELASLEALAAAKLGNAAAMIMGDGGLLDDGWEYAAPMGAYFYVRGPQGEGGEEGVETVRTRYMVRQIEDPATGSAASALTGYLSLKEEGERGGKREWNIVQGVEMGRRSEIGVKVKVEGGKIEEIEISGTAVVVSQGRIRV